MGNSRAALFLTCSYIVVYFLSCIYKNVACGDLPLVIDRFLRLVRGGGRHMEGKAGLRIRQFGEQK
jgi:hypothetical protein